ncbi:MAG: SDR family oxidoreductase [Halobacteriovoraceae bacterium]|nr:SDR family oxidoreductase [Halobacteriovoraceae bacterium]
MKLLVTGALGHIGSKLIREFPKHIPGGEIIMIDDLSTQRYCSLFNLPTEGNYKFFEDNILTAEFDKYMDGVDAVIHLAAITNAAGSFDKQKEVEEVNFIGTKRVADVCAKYKAKFIFLSTTSIYGTQADEVDENCSRDELAPQSPYAQSKFDAEEYLKETAPLSGLEYVTLRFGTIFGTSPGMRFHTAINKFCWQAVMGTPLTVWETALDQKRPYLDLKDGINAILFILKNNIFDGEIYNVLTSNATVRNITEAIKEHVPHLKINFVSTAIMNQLSYNVKNEKFKQLGFEFNGNLPLALQETIKLIKKSNS